MIERTPEQYLCAGINGRLTRIPIKDIAWIQAHRNYVLVHAAGGTHRIRSTLRNLVAMPGMTTFVQIHRSVLVNTAYVLAVRAKSSGNLQVALQNGIALRVGRQYLSSVRNRLREKQEIVRGA